MRSLSSLFVVALAISALALGALAMGACAHQEERARAQRIRPMLLEVDGARTFSADVATVRVASERAMVKLGYELDSAASPSTSPSTSGAASTAPADAAATAVTTATAIVTTKPRVEKIPRWRWLDAQNTLAHDAASVGASVAKGTIPVDPGGANAGTPTDTEVHVSYDLVLAASDADTSATIVHVQPRALVDGADATDTYLTALGADDARHTWEQMFDAIAAELTVPVSP